MPAKNCRSATGANFMVFNEWFGELTDAQRRAYRRHTISPADHDSWSDTGWDGDTIAAWVCALGDLDGSPNCIYGPAWAELWDWAGYTAARAHQVVASVVEVTGHRAFDIRPADTPLASVVRQPSLFEHPGVVE